MKKSLFQSAKSVFKLSYLALIVLFCLAISTSFMAINYLAKYVSTDSNDENASVARFDISSLVAVDQSDELVVWENEKATEYSFSVKNGSDVAVDYDIILDFGEKLPEGTDITVDGNAPEKTEDDVYTFSVGTFAVGEAEKTHTLRIDVSDFDEDVVLRDVAVKIVAQQID